jgi:hypothetical protein
VRLFATVILACAIKNSAAASGTHPRPITEEMRLLKVCE